MGSLCKFFSDHVQTLYCCYFSGHEHEQNAFSVFALYLRGGGGGINVLKFCLMVSRPSFALSHWVWCPELFPKSEESLKKITKVAVSCFECEPSEHLLFSFSVVFHC